MDDTTFLLATGSFFFLFKELRNGLNSRDYLQSILNKTVMFEQLIMQTTNMQRCI